MKILWKNDWWVRFLKKENLSSSNPCLSKRHKDWIAMVDKYINLLDIRLAREIKYIYISSFLLPGTLDAVYALDVYNVYCVRNVLTSKCNQQTKQKITIMFRCTGQEGYCVQTVQLYYECDCMCAMFTTRLCAYFWPFKLHH